MSTPAATGRPGRPLDAAAETLAAARGQLAEGRFAEAAASARRGHEQMAEAYLRAQPSPRREGRAVWNHSGTGAYPGDWDRSARELARNGFNMILPNMLWGGQAHYASDVLPRSETFRRYGDQIAQCVAAARKYHLEVHVWKVHYNLAGAPRGVHRAHAAGAPHAGLRARPAGRLALPFAPGQPAARSAEHVGSRPAVSDRRPAHGLHPLSGRPMLLLRRLPEAVRGRLGPPGAPLAGRLLQRRRARTSTTIGACRQITLLVAAIRRELKDLRPELKLSAAVWGGYPDCRRWVAQDWPAWVRAGDLDFVCPMDYTERPQGVCPLGRAAGEAGRRPHPDLCGHRRHGVRSGLSADGVVGQIYYARLLGAGGFSIFNFDHATAASILPGLGLGVGRAPAVPPHRGR